MLLVILIDALVRRIKRRRQARNRPAGATAAR
jgi:hypothetical protein